MRREELIATVTKIIHQETDIPIEKLNLDMPLTELGIDSLDVLKLALTFEKSFQITISTAELMEIKTVDDIVVGIERKTQS